jgi:hypothetical protein
LNSCDQLEGEVEASGVPRAVALQDHGDKLVPARGDAGLVLPVLDVLSVAVCGSPVVLRGVVEVVLLSWLSDRKINGVAGITLNEDICRALLNTWKNVCDLPANREAPQAEEVERKVLDTRRVGSRAPPRTLADPATNGSRR